MIYRDFKGQKLSQLGFGCMRFASDPKTGEIDQAKVNAMFDLAIREGVNYFDTAYPYLGGKSEIAMAEALSRYPRESYYIADKFPGHSLTGPIDNIALLTDGDFGKLSAEYLDGAAPGVDLTNLNITIDITDYSDETAGLTYNIDGDDIDNSSVVNNRFAFFYDFGDYLGPNAVNGDHVIRYGFIMSPVGPSGSESSYLNPLDSFFDHILYVDKNGNGLTGNDDPTNARNEFVAYVHYGWYCFNETHNESNCPYRGYGDHNSGYAPANQH